MSLQRRDPIPTVQGAQRCSTCMHAGPPLPKPQIGLMCLVHPGMRFPVLGDGCTHHERAAAPRPAPPPFG